MVVYGFKKMILYKILYTNIVFLMFTSVTKNFTDQKNPIFSNEKKIPRF